VLVFVNEMNFRAVLAELIGTFTLIFVGILAINHLGSIPLGGGLVGIAIAHGLAIACLASATGAISGGHLNPAVTLAMMATKNIAIPLGLLYMVVQVVGATVGAVAAGAVMGDTTTSTIVSGTPALGTGVQVGQAILAEAICTFLLVFVIFGTAVDKRAPKLGALLIGFAVSMCIFAIGPVTGAAMNPARYLGPAVASMGFENVLVYLAGPFAGGLVAALLYKHVLMEPGSDSGAE
jgi:MIP family channel proteins